MFHGVGFDRPAGRFEEKILREMLDGTGRTRSASPASSPNGLTSPGGVVRIPRARFSGLSGIVSISFWNLIRTVAGAGRFFVILGKQTYQINFPEPLLS